MKKKSKAGAGKCSLCGVFEKEGWTIENIQNEPEREKFPDAYNQLIVYRPGSATDKHPMLQCPRCGLLYEYSRHMPGGSYDAMVNWLVERITPVMKHDKHVRKNPPRAKVEAQDVEPEYRDCCPACGSFDIDTINAGLIGGESFVTLRCRSCGREDTLDGWQQSLWRKAVEGQDTH